MTRLHHLQILKDAGILKIRKEATKNYYYFDPDMNSFDRLIHVLQKAKELTAELPDRSEPFAMGYCRAGKMRSLRNVAYPCPGTVSHLHHFKN